MINQLLMAQQHEASLSYQSHRHRPRSDLDKSSVAADNFDEFAPSPFVLIEQEQDKQLDEMMVSKSCNSERNHQQQQELQQDFMKNPSHFGHSFSKINQESYQPPAHQPKTATNNMISQQDQQISISDSLSDTSDGKIFMSERQKSSSNNEFKSHNSQEDIDENLDDTSENILPVPDEFGSNFDEPGINQDLAASLSN